MTMYVTWREGEREGRKRKRRRGKEGEIYRSKKSSNTQNLYKARKMPNQGDFIST